ncbi:MAG: distant relative of cell wall-associated hydrolase [Pseudomonadota bacterium]
MKKSRLTLGCLLAAATLLAGCATAIKPGQDGGNAKLAFQDMALKPGNGGALIGAEVLQPGDIILTAENGMNSVGIRLITLSPVSHAAVYLGNGQISEAVGSGIRNRSVDAMVADEATIVAFRHPDLTPEQADGIKAFTQKHDGQKYNFLGVMLQAPFAVERRMCELPLVPSAIRDLCLRGIAAVQLGLGRNDQFFCSQYILEAYRSVGLPLTDADPRLINPGDLLHMREGDVPSVMIHKPLRYVGHLKAAPEIVAIEQLGH